MGDQYFVASKGVLGLKTNLKEFKWSFGLNMPLMTRQEYDDCVIRLNLDVGPTRILPQNANLGKYHYFVGSPEEDALYYRRPFFLNKPLEVDFEGLLSDEPHVTANKMYYRFVRYRFMNLHSIGYILTDIAVFLLLKHGYAPLHCSAFRKGDATVVIFAPPNTGKTISTMMACMEHGAEFLAEDLAITDGRTLYAVPWTSTFRYYSRVEKSLLARTANTLTRIFSPLELILARKAKPISAYVESEKICEQAKITHLAILERGTTSVQRVTQQEAYRKILNLNRFEFNYQKAPLLVAYEFFNPSLNLAGACEMEQNILAELTDNIGERLVVRTDDATRYASLILGEIT